MGIRLAHLFDPMMAVHTSNVEPLPHQITAVHESMLPRQPLRYVLADDPGAGKTIMAGLFIRELLMRADARPCSSSPQAAWSSGGRTRCARSSGWSSHLRSRPRREQRQRQPVRGHRPICWWHGSISSRNDDLLQKLQLTRWDLVVVDEAHKLSANYFGNKINKTKALSARRTTRQYHPPLPADDRDAAQRQGRGFPALLSLLDSDRFYGKFRDGAHKVDVSDLMRRMVKEEMLRFDGTSFFPSATPTRSITASRISKPRCTAPSPTT